MKEIQLTQGKFALVDDEDFERLNQYRWTALKSKSTFYAVGWIDGIKTKMHHLILGKPSKGFVTDHRNGCGLHNFKKNLRHVTLRQNCQNEKNIDKSSQFPGIGWTKREQRWRARIVINGKEKGLGYFTDEHQAFQAYKQAVESLGETVIDTAIQQRSIS